ncbi:MAG: hypothetical protein H0W73_17780 [Bacteroidetes bacterium]|nr:hypothetical protein [Bacteroidota bacterium]
MKKSNLNFAILATFAFMLFISSSFASINKKDSTLCLRLNGIILKTPKIAERGSYKIELLHENKVIDSCKVTVNKEFKFSLYKNNWYTVRVTKEGRVPLLISFDTKMDEENALIYDFLFETEVLDSKKVNASNEIMDFPIGLVKFDKKNNRFYPVEDYTASIKQKIFDPSKSKFFNSDAQDTGKSMMANQDDDDAIVK